MNSTIWEDFTLPSKGLVYDKPIDPHIYIRSLTIMEDMRRQSPSEQKFKLLADMIEECLKEKPAIHVYDMCLGDYEFLLHKLRIVSYGPEYKLQSVCPHCGALIDATCDLDSLEVKEFPQDLDTLKLITLPKSGKNIELKLQTPKDLDIIDFRNKEMKKRTKVNQDYSLLFKAMSFVKTVDGQKLNSIELEEFIKNLQIKDVNMILNKGEELNKKIGLDTIISAHCNSCGGDFDTSFRYTQEFFRPTD